jgi:hypothetical protein
MILRSSLLDEQTPKQPETSEVPHPQQQTNEASGEHMAIDVAVALLDRAINPNSGVLSSPELDTPMTTGTSQTRSTQLKRKDISPFQDEI